jgi:hypothetical protein
MGTVAVRINAASSVLVPWKYSCTRLKTMHDPAASMQSPPDPFFIAAPTHVLINTAPPPGGYCWEAAGFAVTVGQEQS